MKSFTEKELEDLTQELIDKIKDKLKDFVEFILNDPDLYVDDIETLMRDILEEIEEIIQDWLIENFGFKKSDFRNFPPLNELIYHKGGWNLRSAIKEHLKAYNKWRNRSNFLGALLTIIATETQRLPLTTYDVLVEKLDLFPLVTIDGEAGCGEPCSMHYDTYRIGIDNYELPPYHPAYYNPDTGKLVPGCKCKAYYHDYEDA